MVTSVGAPTVNRFYLVGVSTDLCFGATVLHSDGCGVFTSSGLKFLEVFEQAMLAYLPPTFVIVSNFLNIADELERWMHEKGKIAIVEKSENTFGNRGLMDEETDILGVSGWAKADLACEKDRIVVQGSMNTSHSPFGPNSVAGFGGHNLLQMHNNIGH
ncbi:hypothetical protein Salat_1164900 [Sesamum alatum]|uniref:Isochorismatase-like domain-containing protein n=1 Tax=Sesamum alatum TaxID=300844 RepID=A0AAE1YE84_9LAMI|nr:hypothetical protein Salat_1164900 [Sesamum alatum]